MLVVVVIVYWLVVASLLDGCWMLDAVDDGWMLMMDVNDGCWILVDGWMLMMVDVVGCASRLGYRT
jgi:hypothetical protein